MKKICRDDIVNLCVNRIQYNTRYTNCYLTITELEKACDEHQLIAYENEEVYLVLQKKEQYTAIYFWCETWGWLEKLEEIKIQGEKLVISIVQRTGQELSPFFESHHFKAYGVYARLRKSLLTVNTFNNVDVSYCDETDFERLKDLMWSTFDSIGSNIPCDNELRAFLSNQAVICVRDEQSLLKGFVIFEDKGKTSYIRMICVDKAYCGTGMGTQLMSMYFDIHSEFRGYTLWCAVDNVVALNLYSKFGYEQENIYNYIYVL